MDQSPLAVTSSGEVAVGLGYTRDLRSVDQVVALLRNSEVTGTLFVGVVLTGPRQRIAARKLGDVAAEIAATSGVGRRPRGGQE